MDSVAVQPGLGSGQEAVVWRGFPWVAESLHRTMLSATPVFHTGPPGTARPIGPDARVDIAE